MLPKSTPSPGALTTTSNVNVSVAPEAIERPDQVIVDPAALPPALIADMLL